MPDYLPPILVFFVSICTGFIGSQVGSGGSILIPFLIFLGLPPHSAIATHRFGSVFGGTSALTRYIKAKKVIWKYVIPFIVLDVVGAMIGVRLFLRISEEMLSNIVAIFILLPLPFLFFTKIGLKQRETKPWMMFAGGIVYFGLSIWSGIFSPGALTLYIYSLAYFFGFTFIQANATKKLPGIIAKLSLTVVFIIEGLVYWKLAIPLTLGGIIGAYAGASYAVKKGNKWIRTLLAVVVIGLAIKMLFL